MLERVGNAGGVGKVGNVGEVGKSVGLLARKMVIVLLK